jgi:hypothetical protein
VTVSFKKLGLQWEGGGRIWRMYFIFMLESRTMKAEIVLRRGRSGMRE